MATVEPDKPWLIETGERGRGFVIAAFPTESTALSFCEQIKTDPLLMASVEIWGQDPDTLHVIHAEEVVRIRERAGFSNPRKPVGKYRRRHR